MKAVRLVPLWLVLALLVMLPQQCGGRPRPPAPTPRPTLPVITRVPAPVPLPTVGPDSSQDAVSRGTWWFGAPRAAVLLGAPQTQVFTVVDDGTYWNGDVLLKWRHPNPGSVNFYEVWHGLNTPYIEPGVRGELEGTTSALRWWSDAPGQSFTYMTLTPGVDIMGGLDTWKIVACNRAGCAAPSNEIGVVTYSLNQGMKELPNW